MLHFWQTLPYNVNPVIFSIGGFSLRWYWMMYLVGFSIVYGLLLWRFKKGEGVPKNEVKLKNDLDPKSNIPFKKEDALDAPFWMFFGALLGGRLGFFLFYDLGEFLANPLVAINPFVKEGGHWVYAGFYGMSYHGALLGLLIAFGLFVRKRKLEFWPLMDFIIPAVPLGYFFGRIGNFLNGELYGRITTEAIGMYFPYARYLDGGNYLRHPSQLYEAFFEGLVLFAVLWGLRNKIKTPGVLAALYLIGYGAFRFFIEFFREPDSQIGFIFHWLTVGQLLCFGMVGVGMILFLRARKKQKFKNRKHEARP